VPRTKRPLDVTLSALPLVVLSPVLAVIAVAVRLTSRGPALFRQERLGLAASPFTCLKFRTMYADAADAPHREYVTRLLAEARPPRGGATGLFKLEHDPRVTRVGRFLRRTSLDELPQLINVLRGEMSLVGPRPLPLSEDRMVAGYARGRLDLTPGISGLWQVLGRTVIPFDEMVKLDYMYVTNWSLWLDLRLMLQTLPAVLGRRGAN